MPVRFNTGGVSIGTNTSDATAIENQVLEGSTFYAGDRRDIRTGTMPNQGNKSASLNCGQTFPIPEGYHDGTGIITANTLASQTSATAVAGHLLSGQTAWVNGNKISGTMANRGNVSQTLNCGGSYTIPVGYHAGGGKVTANSLASQTSATAAAGNIHSGKTAWVNGSKLTGTAPVRYYASGTGTITSDETIWCSCGFRPTICVARANINGYWYVFTLDPMDNSTCWGVKVGNGQTHGNIMGGVKIVSNGVYMPLIGDGQSKISNYTFVAMA